MASRFTGHRVMITVPKEVYPDLQAFAEVLELPVAAAVRLLVVQMHVTMKETVARVKQASGGDESGAFLGLVAFAAEQQAKINTQTAVSIKEHAEGSFFAKQEPPKKAKKKP